MDEEKAMDGDGKRSGGGTAPGQIIAAELTWVGDRFEAGIQVVVDGGGWITEVGPAPVGRSPTRSLPGKALLPGFVNVHSHTFQRGMRGRGETFPAGAGNFWSWREAMYELAEGLDVAGVHALAVTAFTEMRRAGITTVGEFHYLHHAGEGDYAFDEVVLRAAAEVGIRLVLLEAFYRTGKIGSPLLGAQRRFGSPDLATYWRQMDHLAGLLDPALQSLGTVAHSVRAVPLGEIIELHAEARRRGMVLHLHVEEQRREIEDCLAAYGETPTALLCDRLPICPAVTAVHCTHTAPEDMERYLEAGGNVCICPLTEANLGDGIPDLPLIHARGGEVCLGTDSNARISMLEEIRWLEYVQRLARERRGVLRDDAGTLGAPLLAAATRAGARALGLPVGTIAPGHHGDFTVIDLAAPTLANPVSGTPAAALAPALIFGCAEEAIAGTCVGGRWRIAPTDAALAHGGVGSERVDGG